MWEMSSQGQNLMWCLTSRLLHEQWHAFKFYPFLYLGRFSHIVSPYFPTSRGVKICSSGTKMHDIVAGLNLLHLLTMWNEAELSNGLPLSKKHHTLFLPKLEMSYSGYHRNFSSVTLSFFFLPHLLFRIVIYGFLLQKRRGDLHIRC